MCNCAVNILNSSTGLNTVQMSLVAVAAYVPSYTVDQNIERVSGGDPYPHGKEIGPGSLASSFSKFFFAQTQSLSQLQTAFLSI